MINDEESQIPSTQKDFSVQHDDMDEIINIWGQKISHLNTNLSIYLNLISYQKIKLNGTSFDIFVISETVLNSNILDGEIKKAWLCFHVVLITTDRVGFSFQC